MKNIYFFTQNIIVCLSFNYYFKHDDYIVINSINNNKDNSINNNKDNSINNNKDNSINNKDNSEDNDVNKLNNYNNNYINIFLVTNLILILYHTYMKQFILKLYINMVFSTFMLQLNFDRFIIINNCRVIIKSLFYSCIFLVYIDKYANK